MKKKISLVVAVLVLVLGLAGCGNAKTVSYDKDTLIQSCDAVFDIIESGSITSDQITEMSDWNQGYLMAQFESQTGVQMEADTFATALEGWKASLEECGDYESHKDYEFEASSTGVTVTAPATFSDRSADLEFVFDENMTLESFTVNAHYGMSEILEKAGLNTLLGMGTVFVMLIFMSFIISLIKYVPALLNGTSKKKKEEAQLRNSLEIGDEITTIGGIMGRVVAIKDDEDAIIIETGSDRVKMKFKKWCISTVDTVKEQPQQAGQPEKKGFFGFGKKKDSDETKATKE